MQYQKEERMDRRTFFKHIKVATVALGTRLKPPIAAYHIVLLVSLPDGKGEVLHVPPDTTSNITSETSITAPEILV